MNKDRYTVTKFVTILSAIVNVSLSVFKLCIGILVQSPLLIADGVHSFTDVFADITAFLAVRFSQMAPNEKFQYGYRRLETLASIVIALVLVLAAYEIVEIGVLDNVSISVSGKLNRPVLVAALFAMCVNFSCFSYISFVNRVHKIPIVAGCATHQLSDSLTTFMVFVSVILDYFGVPYVTTMVIVIIVFYILKCSYQLLFLSIQEILDIGVDKEKIEHYRKVFLSSPYVIDIHNLRTRKLGGYVVLDCHIAVGNYCTISEADYIAHLVEMQIKKECPEVCDIVLHVDSIDNDLALNVEDWPDRHKVKSALYTLFQYEFRDEDLIISYSKSGVEVMLLCSDSMIATLSNDNVEKSWPWLSRISVYSKKFDVTLKKT